MSSLVAKSIDSPLGAIRCVATSAALVGVYLEAQKNRFLGAKPVDQHPVLDLAAIELAEYFGGQRTAFETPLATSGTEFQNLVWNSLLDIPFGETWSYAQLARRIGKPKAVRAVGAANSRNPLAIVVPCHRVIGANGALTGYAGGVENKRWLLNHESISKTLLVPERRSNVVRC